jgi:hypothetical protein
MMKKVFHLNRQATPWVLLLGCMLMLPPAMAQDLPLLQHDAGLCGQGTFVEDSLKHGHWEYVDDEGITRERGSYEQGLRVGIWVFLDEAGNRQARVDYDTYIYTAWFPDGSLSETGPITPEWEKDSLWEYYHPGGQVWARGHYSRHQRTGTWEYWYADGSRTLLLPWTMAPLPIGIPMALYK